GDSGFCGGFGCDGSFEPDGGIGDGSGPGGVFGLGDRGRRQNEPRARMTGPLDTADGRSEPEDRSGRGPEQARVAEGALVVDVGAVPQAAGGDGHRVVLPGAVEALRRTDLRGLATGAG